MRVETRLFGPLEVEEDKVLAFPEGLYGFEGLRRFVLIETAAGAPWKWLQSLEDGDICFVVLDPLVVEPGYSPSLSEADLERVGLAREGEAALLVLAVVPEDLTRMTVNLRAPLVLNPVARRGCQVVLPDDRYAIKHPVFAALARAAASAGEPARRSEAGSRPVATVTVGG